MKKTEKMTTVQKIITQPKCFYIAQYN